MARAASQLPECGGYRAGMREEREPRVLVLARRFEAWCGRLESRLARWPGHWEQLERAVGSVIANVGEALDSETLPQKRRYFGYALASAGEARKLIKGYVSAGILTAEEAEEGLRLSKDIRWDLIRLVDWTKR